MDDVNNEEFLSRLLKWEAKLNRAERERDYSRFDALCALYLEATAEQRLQLPSLVAPEDSARYDNVLGGLIVYMGWDAERIKTPADLLPLHLGLAAAAILQERLDDRDIGISLSFLYLAAKRAGIDPVPHFQEIAGMARPETKQFILRFLERDEKWI